MMKQELWLVGEPRTALRLQRASAACCVLIDFVVSKSLVAHSLLGL